MYSVISVKIKMSKNLLKKSILSNSQLNNNNNNKINLKLNYLRIH